jgi:hypothetical protein
MYSKWSHKEQTALRESLPARFKVDPIQFRTRSPSTAVAMATIARRVAAAMERIAPLRLAEKWDNVRDTNLTLSQSMTC